MLKPLLNHVVVEPIEEVAATKSGIILPETIEKDRTLKGRIVSVGAGRVDERGNRISMDVKVGDVILYEYSTSEVKIDEKKYAVVKEENIIAIVE
ncbi:MAG TPA: co-chaperone GroES [Candidatus Paceibacterota bacterium]|nr:co-chaperone GroES [Candidatus Paceibacterota bacterium]HPT40482.1 co-chaperone GroES [Candidatus Paceibacterota bacterium]